MAVRASEGDETISDINIVPLVDIILVVLIIFMVTAPAMVKPRVEVDLPSAASGEKAESTPIQVAISADGRVYYQNREVGADDLRDIVGQVIGSQPETQAVIAADTTVDHGDVVRVMDWLKTAGVKNLAVTTDRPLQGE